MSSRNQLVGAGVAILVLAVAALLLVWASRRGWYPHDEGLLGQSAERVMRGEVPHRDFDDPYTGGLALLSAGAFALFGVKLTVLRLMLAGVAFGWLVGLLACARRWLPPLRAGLLVLLVLVWSVPIYPALIPSWFVLFTVTAAALTLVSARDRWPRAALLIAGCWIGVGLLFKITAVLGLAGILLLLARERQVTGRRTSASIEILLGALLFAVACAMLVGGPSNVRALVHVAGPAMLISLGIAWVECRQLLASRRLRFDRTLVLGALWTVAGVAVAIVPFVIWLVAHDALPQAISSFAEAVGKRAVFAKAPPPPIASIGLGVALLALVAGPVARRIGVATMVVILAFVFVMGWHDWHWHRLTWQAVRSLLPVGAALCAWRWVTTSDGSTETYRFNVFAAMAGCMALTQYPFASPIYFAYVAPLMCIALVVMPLAPAASRQRRDVLIGFILLFGALQVVPGAAGALPGIMRESAPQLERLDVARGGLFIRADDADLYRRLLAALDTTHPGAPLWAGPDAPEVAFLAARIPVGRSFFEFLAGSDNALPFEPDDGTRVDVLVINTAPAFSPPLTASQVNRIKLTYPVSEQIGRFVIRSRGGTE